MLTSEQISNIEQAYKEHLNPSLYRIIKLSGFGGVEVKAQGAWVYLSDGKKFLDLAGGYGVFSFGHSHPKIVSAVKKQLEEQPMSAKVFLCRPQAALAEKLAALAPGDLQYCFFVNSGTEAVEAALKLARAATGRPGIVYASNAFHGKTMGSLSATGKAAFREPVLPLLPGFRQVPFGDIEALREAVDENTAAVIVEPVQGEGGINLSPDGYLPQIREICTERGALFIADEIQCGLGRTGKTFAVEHWGVAPDLMALGKALGGGIMPVGAVMGNAKAWAPLVKDPFFHTSTFGGNPLACAAGLAALEVLEEENLVSRSEEMGAFLLGELKALQPRFPALIQECRGLGMMAGVELKETKYSGALVFEMAKQGLVGVYTLSQPKVIRFEPPLNIDKEDLRLGVEKFAAALDKVKALFKVGENDIE